MGKHIEYVQVICPECRHRYAMLVEITINNYMRDWVREARRSPEPYPDCFDKVVVGGE